MKPTKVLVSLLLVFSFAQLPSSAQKIKRATGLTLSAEGTYWEQHNFNRVLTGLSITSTPSFMLGWGFGTLHRFTNFELGLEGHFGYGRRSGASDRVNQTSGLFNLAFRQHINFKSGSFYPLLGVGLAVGKTEVTQRNGPTDIATALTSRNTASLFNRQGVAVGGVGVQLFESRQRRGFYTLEAGYRFGFSPTKWSTDEESGNYMTNSVTDEMRQVYFKLGIGIIRIKR